MEYTLLHFEKMSGYFFDTLPLSGFCIPRSFRAFFCELVLGNAPAFGERSPRFIRIICEEAGQVHPTRVR